MYYCACSTTLFQTGFISPIGAAAYASQSFRYHLEHIKFVFFFRLTGKKERKRRLFRTSLNRLLCYYCLNCNLDIPLTLKPVRTTEAPVRQPDFLQRISEVLKIERFH